MNDTNHPAGHVLQAFHDGELAGNERTAVKTHCDQCPDCRNELAELAETAALLASAAVPELPRSVWHRVKPSRAREPRFKPAFAFAAAAAGLAIGILLGPVEFTAEATTTELAWAESAMLWDSEASASLLNVFHYEQE